MMVPVLFVTWAVGVLLLSVLLYVGLRLTWQRGGAPRQYAWLPKIDEEAVVLELPQGTQHGRRQGD